MALNFLLKRSGTANKRPDPASMALGELDLNYDAVSGGVFYKDSAGDVVKVGSAQVSATAPNATPAGSAGNSDGEFWYDTANSELKLWDGTAWVTTGGGSGVAGVTGTAPITVDNTDPANPVVGVDAASTSTSGVVQLNDSTSSTSTTEAATANAVKTAYDAGIQGQTDAAAAQATADDAMPISGGTFTGSVTFPASTVGGTILTLDNLISGDGYGFGSYDNEPLTGGTGTGATANITVGFSGGVTDVVLVSGGTGYTVGDSLSAFGPAFDPWSIEVASVTAGSINTVTLNGDTEVNGGFTFNTAPTFPAGVDIGAAEQVTYDNAVSGLTATDVQGAVDEVAATAAGAVPDASYTALGDILSGTGAGTYAALALGADTNVLTVDSTCPGGLKWAAGGGGGAPEATPTTLGTLYGCSGVLANNASVGLNALCAPTSGCLNVAVGVDAARLLTTGRCNTAVGHQAMASVLSSRNNVALGYQALCTAQSGNSNVAVGMCSLFSSLFGYSNVAVGCCAGFALDAGAENTLIGDGAGSLITTGNRNVVIGSRVEVADGTASEQLAIGFNFNRWLTGDSNYAIKPGNGIIDCAGSCGTAGQVLMSTGSNAVCWGTAGGGGSGTVTSITAGAGLTGGTITTSGTIDINFTEVLSPAEFTASGQLLVGTGDATYTALAVGSDTQVLTADSTCTGGVKWAAAGGGGGGTPATPTVPGIVFGCSDGNTNTSLGYLAIEDLCGTSVRNVAVGELAMNRLTTSHCCNIAIGNFAMYGSSGSTNFRCNVAIGNASMSGATGSNILNNVYVGASTGEFSTGSSNVAVGFCSQRSNCGSGNTSVGSCSLAINTGNNNVAVGLNAGCTLGSTAACNILIGPGAGGGGSVGSITGSANIIIGIDKAPPVPAGSTQLVLGNWLTGCSTLAIKPAAGIMDCVLSTGTAGQVLMSNGSNAICWGAAGGASAATPTVAGIVKGLTSDTSLVTALGTCAYSGLIASAPSNSNVAIGYWSMRNSSGTTVNSVALGPLAMYASVGASNNVAIGNSTLCQVQTLNNVAVGNSALRFMTTGACNVALGAGTGGDLDSGSNNTFVGFCAGQFVFSGSRNTWIGSLAGTTTMGETSNNTVLIGACSVLSAANVCNQVGIYNGSVHARFTGAASAWTFASDVRDKENVADLALGLDFVNRVQPRTFTWNMRGSDVDQGKLSAGFIAQELQSLSEDFNADYLELVDTSDTDRYTVAKSNLIPVLVKAIQELSERNDLLEARIATLEGN